LETSLGCSLKISINVLGKDGTLENTHHTRNFPILAFIHYPNILPAIINTDKLSKEVK
jgi:hypothetical protein